MVQTKEDIMTLELNSLSQGSKGGAVKTLQALLNFKVDAALDVDGSFGPATLAAVKNFQKAAGLEVDGNVGPLTWSKILNMD